MPDPTPAARARAKERERIAAIVKTWAVSAAFCDRRLAPVALEEAAERIATIPDCTRRKPCNTPGCCVPF